VDGSDDKTIKAALYDLRREHTLIGKCTVNEDFTFAGVNEVICRYFQCSPAELIGKRFTDITPEPDRTIDTDNALLVMRGERDHYQFPKQYRPPWMKAPTYAVIDVLGVRNIEGKFLHFDVEILEITKTEYLRLRKIVLKQKLGCLRHLLQSTGNLSTTELRGVAVLIALSIAFLRFAPEIAQISLREWLDRFFPLP